MNNYPQHLIMITSHNIMSRLMNQLITRAKILNFGWCNHRFFQQGARRYATRANLRKYVGKVSAGQVRRRIVSPTARLPQQTPILNTLLKPDIPPARIRRIV